MPSFEPRCSINMQTSLPSQVTTVDQDSPARQIGCGGKGESLRTLFAAFPPRSGFVQPAARGDAQRLQRQASQPPTFPRLGADMIRFLLPILTVFEER